MTELWLFPGCVAPLHQGKGLHCAQQLLELWWWPTSLSKMKLIYAKKHCANVFWGSLSSLQKRAGVGRGEGRSVFQVGAAQGEQLSQAQAGVLPQYQGIHPDLRMSSLLACSQTILPLYHNFSSQVFYSFLKWVSFGDFSARGSMWGMQVFVHGNILFFIISPQIRYFLQMDVIFLNEFWINMFLSILGS